MVRGNKAKMLLFLGKIDLQGGSSAILREKRLHEVNEVKLRIPKEIKVQFYEENVVIRHVLYPPREVKMMSIFLL